MRLLTRLIQHLQWSNPEREVLLRFIISNDNNLRYADNTVLIADIESKLQELLHKVVKESEKKELIIKCKMTECMDGCQQNEHPNIQITN